MVFALADVQAEEGADVTDVDHVRPLVVLARPSHGTDRHIHMTKSLSTCGKAGGHAPKGLQIIKVLLPVPWLVDVVCASRTRSVLNSP
ncbi:hypothetical protein GCM10020295_01280 [Streptomyces cinereospinus]